MRSFVIGSVCLAMCLFGESVEAAPDAVKSNEPSKGLELQVGIGAGGPAGLIYFDELTPGETSRFTAFDRIRLRVPARSSTGIELSFIPGHGYGINLLSDIIRIGNFRLHLTALGAFWNQWSPVSVTPAKRGLDVSVGAGAEMPISKDLFLTIDWRAYVPNPLWLSKAYGNGYSDVVTKEALKGGQIWIGCAWRLPF